MRWGIKKTQSFPIMDLSAFFLMCILLLFFCSSCSKHAYSIFEQFDQIDTYISNQQYDKAFSALKSTEKKAQTVNSQLGVIKRGLQLAEQDWTEQLLAKDLEKYPDSLEIRAVYTHLLLRSGKIEKVFEVGQKLESTDYGSLYAEAVIQKQLLHEASVHSEGQDDNAFNTWKNTNFIPLYQDLFKTTKNENFIINNALINLEQGDYLKAFSFHPDSVSVYDNAFFWAQLSYDSNNFLVALDDLSYAPDVLKTKKLLADSYVKISNIDDAFVVWNDLINTYPDSSVLAYLNAARKTYLEGDLSKEYEYLNKGLLYFPKSVPLLAALGDYALVSTAPYDEDAMDAVLRSKDLKTIAMEERDKTPVVQPSDVAQKMNAVLKSSENADLQLAYTKLLWAIDTVPITKRCSDMWLLLEKNRDSLDGEYNYNLCMYAIWLFLHNSQYDDAQQLISYLINSNHFSANTDWKYNYFAEVQAWLAYKQNDYDKAVELYQSISGLELQTNTSKMQNVMSYSALFNLGALYVASGQKVQAQALYENALSFTTNNIYFAELEFRIAGIQIANGKKEEAIQSLQFCLKKDPAHNRARLLLKKLSLL